MPSLGDSKGTAAAIIFIKSKNDLLCLKLKLIQLIIKGYQLFLHLKTYTKTGLNEYFRYETWTIKLQRPHDNQTASRPRRECCSPPALVVWCVFAPIEERRRTQPPKKKKNGRQAGPMIKNGTCPLSARYFIVLHLKLSIILILKA